MAAQPEDTRAVSALTFRRFRDGDHATPPLREAIFKSSWSHKCPTYVQSTPPCQNGCPAREDIRGWLGIVRGTEKPPQGVAWQEYAWRRLTEANPFPAVMGRVCPAPCEKACNRKAVEEPVGINAVEHFLGDYAIAQGLRFPKPQRSSGKKVAVIGGGPAGLSCAYQLALKGHAVTIFDEHERLGGMMRYGIPGFRAPREVLDAEIGRILELGVETRLRCRVGTNVTMDEIRAGFDAVFIGLGAQAGRPLPVGPAHAQNVVLATDFLRAFNDGRLKLPGKRVVVVGGGDTSIDVATVSRRLGADATLTSVFPIEGMQANPHEIEQAIAEGVAILGGFAPTAVIEGEPGLAVALRVAPCEAKFVGTRLQIDLKSGSAEIPADLIVSAIGQAVEFTGLDELAGKGAVPVDRNYRVTGDNATFAGGDALRPHLLTTAIGHGAIAAEGIDRFLSGAELGKRAKVDVQVFDLVRKLREKGLEPTRATEPMWGTCDSRAAVHNYDNRSDRYVITERELFLAHFPYTPRLKRKVITLTPENVQGNFEERLAPLAEPDAVAEAKRCMSCGMCFECDNCIIYCPQKAVFRVPKANASTGRYVDTDYDRCIGCHICHDVCPTGYIQMGLGE